LFDERREVFEIVKLVVEKMRAGHVCQSGHN
jgi:hypothetical protein